MVFLIRADTDGLERSCLSGIVTKPTMGDQLRVGSGRMIGTLAILEFTKRWVKLPIGFDAIKATATCHYYL